MRRVARLVTAAVGATLLLPVAPATGQEEQGFAPVDQPGPELQVPEAELRDSLVCTGDLAASAGEPILLIPGTTLTPEANFSWNYEPAFRSAGRAYCTVELPLDGMGDIQTAAEHVVFAIREVATATGGPVDIVGFSQGGMIGRWALRWWPDTRSLVDDLIGLAPSNHGTETARPACADACVPAYHQQRSDAAFIAALNSIQETFAGVDYTVAYTWTDEVVTPNVGPDASSPLPADAGRVSNVAVQEVCPGHAAEHLQLGSYDAVGYAVVVDALDHDGPADPARIELDVCAEPFMPGVDPATFPQDWAAYLGQVGQASAEHEPVDEEPPLRCYVTATCPEPGPPTDAPGAPGTTASEPDPGPAGERGSLPATGGGAAVLLLVVLTAAVGGRRRGGAA